MAKVCGKRKAETTVTMKLWWLGNGVLLREDCPLYFAELICTSPAK